MRTLAFALPLLLLAGCGSKSKEEALAHDMAVTLDGLAAAIESAKDEASAKAALPKVEKHIAEMNQLVERKKGIPDDAMEKVSAETQQRVGKATQRMMGAMMAMSMNEAVQKVLEPAMAKMKDFEGK